MTAEQTQFGLLRHGHCLGGNIFRGSTDAELSGDGLECMRRACRQTNRLWDRVVTSPSQRCCMFAAEYAEMLGVPVQHDHRLREMYFGDWEGRCVDEVWREDEQRVRDFYANPLECGPPNGETLQALADRVDRCLTDLVRHHRGQRLLVVTHGGVIRVLLSIWLDVPLVHAGRWDVPYACLTHLSILHTDHGDLKKLVAHNVFPDFNAHA